MKYILTILMLFGIAYGQSTYYMRYDTVKISRGTGGTSELIVESATKDSTNGVMINYGNGRTRFQRIRAISATKFTVGTDTITITGSGGGGGGGTWGSITGTLSSQTDLQAVLNSKMDTGDVNLVILNAGSGIQTWYETNDSLRNKRLGNTYGFNWTTLSDSTLNGAIDSNLYVSKLNRNAFADSIELAFAGKQGTITLTTTGSSGAATLIGNTLNIPQYSGGSSYSAGYGLTLTSTTFAVDTGLITSKLDRQKLKDSIVSLITAGSISASQVKQYVNDPFRQILLGLGSTNKYESLGKSRNDVSTTAALTDGRVNFVAVQITEATTITGVEWYQPTQGSYTADNNNKIGLYSYSGGTMTLVASCADDGNLWKPSSTTYNTKAFTTPYSAAVGTYFIASLYNSSAASPAPSIAQYVLNQNANLVSAGLTNSAKYTCYVAGSDLPATQAMSGTTASNAMWFFSLY